MTKWRLRRVIFLSNQELSAIERKCRVSDVRREACESELLVLPQISDMEIFIDLI